MKASVDKKSTVPEPKSRRKVKKKPRILVVTPEVTDLPNGMGNMAVYLQAKSGGLADVASDLVTALFENGVDVHIAVPHYRQLFKVNNKKFVSNELRAYMGKMPDERIHLAEDRVFYYQQQVYHADAGENIRIALTFQREVINNIIPRVRPDLIHCNDWMTGLIPAFAKRVNIPCLFSIHNIHTVKISLAQIEPSGLDTAQFWNHLYFERMPVEYNESRESNPVDMLSSGIFAAGYINTVSTCFLKEIVDGHHAFVSDDLRNEIRNKFHSGYATGINNSPNPSLDPRTDKALARNYDAQTHVLGKRINKQRLQQLLNLEQDNEAPLFFWPSRLDPVQKGCQLLTDILYKMTLKYWKRKLQIVVIADGPHQEHFHKIVRMHEFEHRIAIQDFDGNLASLAYAASDFILMPSLYEPCGLPQMIAQKYGSLPIARDTGGLHDTVIDLDVRHDTGNGFLFKDYDTNGLSWAIDHAMDFYSNRPHLREQCISRIMVESAERFDCKITAKHYSDTYERILNQSLGSDRK